MNSTKWILARKVNTSPAGEQLSVATWPLDSFEEAQKTLADPATYKRDELVILKTVDAESEALVAAAPDLLEAAHMAVEQLEASDKWEHRHGTPIVRLKNAIRKAERKS